MPNQMTNDQIQSAALAAGFTLKPQPAGGMALHPHVFEFARAMFAAGQQAAQDQIADLSQQLEQSSENFQLALLSSSQWQQRAELAERQRDEWRALAESLHARLASECTECGGSHIVAELPMDGSAIQYQPCKRCGGTCEINKNPCLRCRGAVMTDQELLRLAALAYESKDVFFSDFCGCFYAYYKEDEEEGDSVYEWNPLNDDGDALRLRNRINAAVVDEGGQVCVSVSRYPFATVTIRQHYEADTPTGNASPQAVDAAVRRAIVRAAAEIGLRMEGEPT